jgi:hypothetical protein
MPSGMARVVDHQPEDVDDGPHRGRGQAPPPLGDADPPAGEALDRDDGEALPQVPGTAVAGRMAGP